MVNVLIGGDIYPRGNVLPYFKKGDAQSIFNDLFVEFEEADLSIINLECPLIDVNTPIEKNGPVHGVKSECINGLKNAKIDILSLANNHIMDHGSTGLKNTIEVSAKAKMLTVGAGENLNAARQIIVKNVGKIRIGVLAVAEHEFSIATGNSWGANPLDLIDYVRNVRCQKDNFDYLIVLIHGGNEHYPLPSPRLKKVCRFMVEMGANAVVVQHTHCPGSYEEYQKAHIVYGQGNLLFDWPNQVKSFYEGFLVKLSITEDFSSTMNIVPYLQSNSQIGARKMDKEAEESFLCSFKKRSRSILDDTFIQKEWLKFCEERKNAYLSSILGHNRLFSKLNTHGHLVKYFYTAKSLIRLQNFVSCESHREVLETIFNHRMV